MGGPPLKNCNGPLKNCIIACTGDFGPQRPERKMRDWCEKNGAQYAIHVDSSTTHLVCTKEEFKKRTRKGE